MRTGEHESVKNKATKVEEFAGTFSFFLAACSPSVCSTHAVRRSTNRFPEAGFSNSAAFLDSNSSPSSGTSVVLPAKMPGLVKLAKARIQLESTVRAAQAYELAPPAPLFSQAIPYHRQALHRALQVLHGPVHVGIVVLIQPALTLGYLKLYFYLVFGLLLSTSLSFRDGVPA